MPIGGRDAFKLIVFDIDSEGPTSALAIVLPMIANAILNKSEIAIQKSGGFVATLGMGGTGRQAAAEVVPVCRGWVWRKHLTQHRDLFVGVENLAQ